VRLREHLPVATCIACGARSRGGECDEGCADIAIDLVDVSDIEALTAHLAASGARTEALREVVERVAEDDWDGVREQACAALGTPAPGPLPVMTIVEAWGCPACGRIDAPQPCLGVCVRRPVLMADAAEARELESEAARQADVEASLASVVTLVAHVRPRAGQEPATRAALRARARAVTTITP